MIEQRIQRLARFIIAASRRVHDEEWMLRELGPIHVLKYVYLADLEYASEHGETFTGIDWTFHHFGPWSAAAHDLIRSAPAGTVIYEKTPITREGEEFVRWGVQQEADAVALEDELKSHLPIRLRTCVRQWVRNFGNDTPALLDHVYRTKPMRQAAPGDELTFMKVPPRKTNEDSSPEVRAKAQKLRREHLQKGRERMALLLEQRRREREAQAANTEPIPYDQVFDQGTAVLDEIAGSPIASTGTLVFDDSIWRSPTRQELEDTECE